MKETKTVAAWSAAKWRLTKGGYTAGISGIGVINACSPNMKESLTSELFEDESDHRRYEHFLSSSENIA